MVQVRLVGLLKMWKLQTRLIRTIPEIVIENIWSIQIETITVRIEKPPKEVIPDKILNISWLFK